MKAEFRPTTAADAPAIAAFLARIFQATGGEPILDHAMMQWKYWTERPGWQGSRSFVLERGGSIVAHGAAWPARILAPQPVPSFVLIDWAASPEFPGGGVSIVKHMSRVVPLNFLYGGTDIARRMRAAIGYRPANLVHTLALPLHPWRQILTSPRWNWKTPARLARNFMWSRSRPRPLGAWSAVPVPRGEIVRAGVAWPSATPLRLTVQRDPELFETLTACPVAPGAFFLVQRDSRPAGYFCLTFPPGQARIADAFLETQEPEDWSQLYALAVEEARRVPRVNEVVAAAAGQVQLAALQRCGFHVRAVDPMQIYDPQKLLPPGLPLEVQLIDGDASFRFSSGPEYLS